MKRDRSNDAPKSAAELMAELNADPDYVARLREREQRQAQNAESYQLAAAPMLRELVTAGYGVKSLSELGQPGTGNAEVVPILVSWLSRVANPQVKEDLVRTLSVPWAAPAAVPALIAEFKKADGPQATGLRWAIANGLAVTADDAVFEEIAALAKNEVFGKAREMLVLALGNCRDPRAVDVLVGLLDNEVVAGHAVMALGKLKSKTAKPRIQELLSHRTAWVRAEAIKALAAIDGLPSAV